MSVYSFAPSTVYHHVHDFITWDNAFTDDELNKIQEYAETLEFSKATIDEFSASVEYDNIRSSSVAWISNNQEIDWLYEKIAYIARQINAQFFNFDLYGFVEDMQYTVYADSDNSHYTWHIDMSPSSIAPRKLSLVLQLSDPSEYEGGDLQSFIGSEPKTVDKKRGLIAAFPAWTLHRVTPVTKGIRHTLVVWVCGPSFK